MSIALTWRYRILQYLDKVTAASIGGLIREFGVTKSLVLEKLYIAKRLGHIRMEVVPERWPTGQITMTKKVWITRKGREWLQANKP